MAAEPAQHAMNNFVNADSMPAQPEQQMPGFEPKMANPTVRQATGTQVRDGCVGAILYWWDIATFFRCAIERDPSNCAIALVGVPHSTGNGTTRDYPHRGMLARRGFFELSAHDATLLRRAAPGQAPARELATHFRSRSG